MKNRTFRDLMEHIREEMGQSVAIEHVYLFSLVMEGIDYTGDIAREGYVSRASLSRGLLRLEFQGFVYTEPEGKGRKIRLAEKGRELAAYIRGA
jgi:DNA-binding MarR family transcriptional regulator